MAFRPVSRMPDIDVNLVRTAADVQDFMAWLRTSIQAGEAIAVDTETTGLDWLDYGFVRLAQFGTADKGYAIPVEWWGRVIAYAFELLFETKARIVMQNAQFDMHAIRVSGWQVPRWEQVIDTKFLLHLHRSDLSASLKSAHVAGLLGGWIFEGQGLLRRRASELHLGAEYWRWIPVDEPAYWAYGVIDTCVTRLVYDRLYPEISAAFPDQLEREMRYAALMYRVEERGLRVDSRYTSDLRDQMTADIERDLYYLQAAGIQNPNSNQQLAALLETDFDWVPYEWTDTGQPALNKHVLAHLAQAGGMQADVVETLIRYKRNVKWRGTYLDRFLNGQDRHGYVHPSINTTGAKTGRSSIQNPPLQTLPSGDPMIRRCILPPVGHQWWGLDYSNQEPRTLAHFGGSQALMSYFSEGDGTGSIHDFVASSMFGPNYTKEQRSMAKVFGLSRSYGAGAESMAKASGLPVEQVQDLLPRYDSLVGLRELNALVYQVAESRDPTPYVITGGGRRVYSSPDEVYKLVNYLIQGTSSDGLKTAALLCDDEGLGDYIQAPIHDELTFAFPKDEGPSMARRAAELMVTGMNSVAPRVHFPVDISGPGKSWGHLYMKAE